MWSNHSFNSGTASEAPADPNTPKAPDRAAPRAASRGRGRTVIAIAAGVVLIGVAFGIGEGSGASAQQNLAQTRQRLTAVRSQLNQARNQLAAARSQLVTAQDQAQTARNAAAQANARAQARFAAKEAKLTTETRALDALIGRIQASAISTDGVYVVGQDIKTGIWHTTGDAGLGGNACYYATLRTTNTFDIIDNNNFDGPETVDVNGAYALEISGPCTWYRVSS
jgi:hypothetical protein